MEARMIDTSVADVGRHIYSRKLIGISDAMNRYLVRVARSLSIFGSVLVMIMAFCWLRMSSAVTSSTTPCQAP